MSLGSVSFVNVVKALEPVFTAAITLLVLGKNMPWQVPPFFFFFLLLHTHSFFLKNQIPHPAISILHSTS